MGKHYDTPIFKASADLTRYAMRASAPLRRDLKPVLGRFLLEEALHVQQLIRRANIAVGQAKVPYFDEVLYSVDLIGNALIGARDEGFLHHGMYAESLPITVSLMKQASALKEKFDAPASAPVS